jgi:hypothetical protein
MSSKSPKLLQRKNDNLRDRMDKQIVKQLSGDIICTYLLAIDDELAGLTIIEYCVVNELQEAAGVDV